MLLYIWIFFLHFIGDFVLQSDKISKAKSKSLLALTIHIAIITLTLFIGLLVAMIVCDLSFNGVALFALINGILHFIIDYITSKVSAYFYAKGQIHNFFITIGFDQFLHFACYFLCFEMCFCAVIA